MAERGGGRGAQAAQVAKQVDSHGKIFILWDHYPYLSMIIHC